jgi:tRNA (guanine37-N1)-methyltransferase
MRFDVITLFPELFNATYTGVTGRAFRELGHTLATSNYRSFAHNTSGHVDDSPFGGGSGMVLKPEILRDTLNALPKLNNRRVIHFSPSAPQLNHSKIIELLSQDQIVLVCTRYKGLDQRAIKLYIDEELSVGSVVLSGGELPALFLIDAMCRWLPGVLGNDVSATEDSFATGLLDHPHFTRPAVFEELEVPSILLSGDHKKIRLWRLREAMEKTKLVDPNLWTMFLANKLPTLPSSDQWQAWQVEHPECRDLPKPKKWKLPSKLDK